MNQLLNQYTDEIKTILAKYPPEYKRSAVMPLLYLAQRAEGFITRRSLDEIAEIVGMSVTDVAAVEGFYSLYYDHPAGKFHIQVCTDLPCALRGAETFLQELCAKLGVKPGEVTADGLFVVEEVKCLAACHRAPMFQLQGGGDIAYHENQTVESALALIEALRARQKEAAHD